ncbi:hypothetical protein ACO0QE_001397 [Hanseniaspora vineae]
MRLPNFYRVFSLTLTYAILLKSYPISNHSSDQDKNVDYLDQEISTNPTQNLNEPFLSNDIASSVDGTDIYLLDESPDISIVTNAAYTPADFAWDAVNFGLAGGTALLSCQKTVLVTDAGKIQCGLAIAATAVTGASFLVSIYDGLTQFEQTNVKSYFKNLGFDVELNKENSAISTEGFVPHIDKLSFFHHSSAFKVLKDLNLGLSFQPVEKFYAATNETVTDFHVRVFGHDHAFFNKHYNMEFLMNKRIARMAAESKYAQLPMTAVSNIYSAVKDGNWKEMSFKQFVLTMYSVWGDKTEEFVSKTKSLFSSIEFGENKCQKRGFQMVSKENFPVFQFFLEKC